MYRSVVEEDGSGVREADPSEVRRIMSKVMYNCCWIILGNFEILKNRSIGVTTKLLKLIKTKRMVITSPNRRLV